MQHRVMMLCYDFMVQAFDNGREIPLIITQIMLMDMLCISNNRRDKMSDVRFKIVFRL